MKILIVGAGKLGVYLASFLEKKVMKWILLKMTETD